MVIKRDSVTGLQRFVCLAGLVWVSSFVCLGLFGGGMVLSAAEEIPAGVLKELSSDKFETRDHAYGELSKWAKSHLKTSPELLYEAWKSSDQPEVQTRCYALMKESALSREFGRGKGFVGVLMDLKPVGFGAPQKRVASKGVLIVQVLPKTPGEKAGLKPGDFILGIDQLDFNKLPKDQQNIDARTLFQKYVKSKHPDDIIVLHLLRRGKRIDKKVTLMRRPASADRGFLSDGKADERVAEKAYFKKWLKKMEGTR